MRRDLVLSQLTLIVLSLNGQEVRTGLHYFFPGAQLSFQHSQYAVIKAKPTALM